ncbi:dimethyl sulfoxide reductase anchor subunit family protein [Lysobacter antibioticus]|uniref:dimethyl sulfoxide reductase anchor subunit family protein n=1 Tax=Lysobacter antibioticus TaxID=84531 RepID=UPI0004D031F1|nr:DmsC/YnfH family molybdoenzyme membrane anchor subunit [Lysobacter antibioticus]
MHPAFSVIFFTTLSGAGYGLMAWLGVFVFWQHALSGSPQSLSDRTIGFALIAALALVSVGLLSSMLHLGKPARAWRAFSQWRTSWLSREGVMAVVTYLPALALGLWLWPSSPLRDAGAILPAALAAMLAICSMITVACTAMIYASLPPIPAWRHRLVVPGYLLFALFGGAALLAAIPGEFAAGSAMSGALLLLALLTAAIKLRYWRDIDRTPLTVTRGDAVGLPQRELDVFERPHTEDNYLTREMGYVLARKHSRKLRRIALALFAVAPVVLSIIALALPAVAVLAMPLATLSLLLGTLVERWLFFAEARHLVTLYY